MQPMYVATRPTVHVFIRLFDVEQKGPYWPKNEHGETETIRKCDTIANALQPEGRTTSRRSLWAVFGQIYTAHAQKLRSKLPMKTLTSPLDSATLIS